MQEDRNPRDYGARCRRCPFSKGGCPNVPVFGEGPADPLGVLVGEGPGRDEVEWRRPFVGATGKMLDQALVEVKLPRAKLFVVNATCCRPPIGKTDAQMRSAVERCRPVLLWQLQQLTLPDLHILAMGKWAHFALTGHASKLDSWRGFLQDYNLQTVADLVTSWIQKRKEKRRADLRKAPQLRLLPQPVGAGQLHGGPRPVRSAHPGKPRRATEKVEYPTKGQTRSRAGREG